MGINMYQYSGSSNTCMMCNDPDLCSACDEPRTLPWTNDYPSETFPEFNMENFEDIDDDGSSEDEAKAACESAGHLWNSYDDVCFEPYVADIMDANLRDFIMMDRTGNEIARVNLTGYNPDPIGAGECSGNYESIKNLIIDIINN